MRETTDVRQPTDAELKKVRAAQAAHEKEIQKHIAQAKADAEQKKSCD